MSLVDTHCHIQSVGSDDHGEQSTRDLWAKTADLTADSIIAEAHQAGVDKLICVGCDYEDSKLAIDFAANRGECWASIGIHPHEAKKALDEGHLGAFAELVAANKVVAVGECGLDYFYGHSPREAQLEVLRFQLNLAKKHDLPMIFHVREAFDDFWPIFEEYEGIRGVLHSFTDSRENLDKALEKGLFIGVNGIATFAKTDSQIEVYKAIPLDKMVLETDAPFLTPTPYRGTINSPKYVKRIADFVAEQRGVSLNEVSAATTSNAQELFGI